MLQNLETKEKLNSIGKLIVNRFSPGLLSNSDNKLEQNYSVTNVTPYSERPIMKGDSEADILAKLFNFLLSSDRIEKNRLKREKDYNTKYEKLREKRSEEFLSAVSDKKSKSILKSKGGLSSILAMTAGIGALLYSDDVKAMIQKYDFEKMFDLTEHESLLDQLKKLFDSFRIGSDGDLETAFTGIIPGAGPKDSTKFDEYFKSSEQKYNLPPGLLKSLAKAESSFKPEAVSKAGAIGVMQLMPATAAQYGAKGEDIKNTEKNIDAGAKYLKHLLDMFGGDAKLAVAAYNAGEGTVQRAGNKIPDIAETKGHVEKVMKYWSETPASSPESTSELTPPVKDMRISEHGHLGAARLEGGKYHHTHQGVDYMGEIGNPVMAAHSGTVELREQPIRAGKYIVLKGDDGYETKYMHLNKFLVQPGQRVEKGQTIAEMGDTGSAKGAPHLHFEIRKNEVLLNPEQVIPSKSSQLTEKKTEEKIKPDVSAQSLKPEIPKKQKPISGQSISPNIAKNTVIIKQGDTITSYASNDLNNNSALMNRQYQLQLNA